MRPLRRMLAVSCSCWLAFAATAAATEAIQPFLYIDLLEDDALQGPTVLEGSTIDPDASLIVEWRENDLLDALVGNRKTQGVAAVSEEKRLTALRDLVEAFLEANSALMQAKALGPATLSAAARRANDDLATSGQRALQLAQDYRQALEDAGKTREADAFRTTINALVLEESYRPLAEFMRAEIASLNQRVANALAEAPQRRIQMRATLVGAVGSRRLHLAGYDTFDTFEPRETPRFQFDLDERARQEVQAADEMGEVVRQAVSGEMKQKLQDALRSVDREMEELSEAIRREAIAGKIDEALARMRESGDARFGPAIDAGETLLSTLDGLRLNTPPFESSTRAEVLLQIYAAVRSQVGGLLVQLRGLPAQIEDFVDEVKAVAEALPSQMAAEIETRMLLSLDRLRSSPEIGEVIDIFETIRRSLGVNLEIAEAALDGSEVSRKIDDSLDTRLDLLISTPGRRYGGDVVILEAVISEGEQKSDRILGRGFRKIRLQQTGLRGEIRGALIFSNPRKSTLADQAWEPTAAVGYMLHFGRKSGRFWNEVLDPGIGVAMTVLDYQDEDDFEFGLAANISIFRSLLWVGYGRNIQAETDFFHLGVNPLALGRLFREGRSGMSIPGSAER